MLIKKVCEFMSDTNGREEIKIIRFGRLIKIDFFWFDGNDLMCETKHGDEYRLYENDYVHIKESKQ